MIIIVSYWQANFGLSKNHFVSPKKNKFILRNSKVTKEEGMKSEYGKKVQQALCDEAPCVATQISLHIVHMQRGGLVLRWYLFRAPPTALEMWLAFTPCRGDEGAP